MAEWEHLSKADLVQVLSLHLAVLELEKAAPELAARYIAALQAGGGQVEEPLRIEVVEAMALNSLTGKMKSSRAIQLEAQDLSELSNDDIRKALQMREERK